MTSRNRLLSPEAEAGGGRVVAPEVAARMAVRDCGGRQAAIEWAERWAHRPYFRRVAEHLRRAN